MADKDTEFRWVPLPEIERRVGKSASTIRRWSKAGNFPTLFQLGPNTIAARSDHLDAWDESRAPSLIPSPNPRARRAQINQEPVIT